MVHDTDRDTPGSPVEHGAGSGVPAMQPGAPREGGRAVWTERELSDLHARDDKADRVRAMFAAIAGKYDFNNRLHSFGNDQRWRAHAVKRAAVREGEVVVDVACGTGDLTERFAAETGASRVLGVDFTHEMLEVARDRLGRRLARADARTGRGVGPAGRVAYVTGDAMALPLKDQCCDVLSIAFGIRNVQDVPGALAEFARVLRPGGRLVILEFDTPRFGPVRWANDFYSGWLMPRTASLIARDRSGAYKYLPKSVGSFLSREALMAEMARAGFSDLRRAGLTFGICACYSGRR